MSQPNGKGGFHTEKRVWVGKMDGHFMCNHSERANKSVSGLASEETEGRTKKIRIGHSPNIMARGAATTTSFRLPA